MVEILIFDFGLRVIATKSGFGHQKIIFSRIRLNPDSQLRQFIIEWGGGEKKLQKRIRSLVNLLYKNGQCVLDIQHRLVAMMIINL